MYNNDVIHFKARAFRHIGLTHVIARLYTRLERQRKEEGCSIVGLTPCTAFAFSRKRKIGFYRFVVVVENEQREREGV